MNNKLFGTAMLTASSALLIGGCGILETVPIPEIPEIRFDSNSYIVQPGDTLKSVASRYKIDPASLKAVNSLQLAELVPGQKLLLLRDDDAASLAGLSPALPQDVAVQEGLVNGVGQTVVVPNATQTVPNNNATVRPLSEQAVIESDLMLAPGATEEIVAIVDVPGTNDALLDDSMPVMKAEGEDAMVRPEGVETIVKSFDASESMTAPEPLAVPDSGSVSMIDADSDSPVQRITVNQHVDGWNWPAIGKITAEFDLREINRQGLDIDPGPGVGIQAAADGEVVYSGRDLASYGNLVILRHENNYLSAYSKVSDIFVKENQKVKAGDLIASVGDGESGKTELHFEIRRNGEPVNPVDYLPAL